MGHEKWPRAFWYYGATERHLHYPIAEEADRRAVETDLIRGLKPRMNDVEIPDPNRKAKPKASPAQHGAPAAAKAA